jgi:hypothetical protein
MFSNIALNQNLAFRFPQWTNLVKLLPDGGGALGNKKG